MGNRRRKRNKFPSYVKRLFKPVPCGTTIKPSKKELEHILRIQRYREIVSLTKNGFTVGATPPKAFHPKVPRTYNHTKPYGWVSVYYTGYSRRK